MSCATRPLPSSTPTYIRCPPSGQCWQIQESNGRTSIYGYDSLYRLKSEAISADPLGHNGITTYTYDAVGNRQTRTSTLGLLSAQSLTYNARDWADGDTYDANGNTLVGGATAPATTGTDTYDFEDRLLRRTLPDGTSIALKYDGDGLRHSKTVTPLGGPSQTTYFVVDTLNPTGYAQVLEELVEDPLFPSSLTVTKAYTYGHDLVACEQLTDGLWQTHYYGYDGHGSTRQLFDANGHLTDTYTYDAFGTLLSRTGTTDNHYLYCGEQWDDDLGLYYLRARYMNPWAGRFWSMDSFEGYLNDPQSLHKYLYAHANPVMYVDYSGFETLTSQQVAMSVHTKLQKVHNVQRINQVRKNMCKVGREGLYQLHHLVPLFAGGKGSHKSSKSDAKKGWATPFGKGSHSAYHSILRQVLKVSDLIPGAGFSRDAYLRAFDSGEIDKVTVMQAIMDVAIFFDFTCKGTKGYKNLVPPLKQSFRKHGFKVKGTSVSE